MSIFESLMTNKGTLSSALGKKYAAEVLNGDHAILEEAIVLSSIDLENDEMKHVRAGAAKIVEIVAEKSPESVAPFLDRLFAPLDAPEPQTRWMIIRTFGFCAHLDKKAAKKAVPFAKKYLGDKEGLVIASSADLFLGDLGAISEKEAMLVCPILLESARNTIRNEQDWLLEAFIKIVKNAGTEEKQAIIRYAKRWEKSERKSTQARVRKLLKLSE